MEPMNTTTTETDDGHSSYDTELWAMIECMLDDEPGETADCRTFEDLHEVCNANEFLELAALNSGTDTADPAYPDVADQGAAYVSARMAERLVVAA